MSYFRITGYHKDIDGCFILDSNGLFEKLWEFSSYLLKKGVEVLEVSKEENMIEVNIDKAPQDDKHIILRASADGRPEYIQQIVNGVTYKAVKVESKIYIPNKEEKI